MTVMQMTDNHREKSKNRYLEFVDIFFDEKCRKCTNCGEKKECRITMLMNGSTTIFGTPSCICDDEEFEELMNNEN